MQMLAHRKSDIIEKDGITYVLYWQTALDGKTWCRVKVYDNGKKYQYRYYFETKKAARQHISICERKVD